MTENASKVCTEMRRFGIVRDNFFATTGQWAGAVAVITATFIILAKSSSSTVTIGDLRAIAISLLIGALFGIGAYSSCLILNKIQSNKQKSQ